MGFAQVALTIRVFKTHAYIFITTITTYNRRTVVLLYLTASTSTTNYSTTRNYEVLSRRH